MAWMELQTEERYRVLVNLDTVQRIEPDPKNSDRVTLHFNQGTTAMYGPTLTVRAHYGDFRFLV